MKLICDKWVDPFIDTTSWEWYDLSCKARDDSQDKVLHDAVKAGAKIGAIFKEPTITPSALQVKEFGLKKAWGSPNGAMRRGWNGITISRDTIHIPGVELGYKRPVYFERHAVGGEYAAGWSVVGKGHVVSTFFPDDDSKPPAKVNARQLTDTENAIVIYDNPYDNIEDLAHIFFERCLKDRIVPYVVTKKTVFKWQEAFWKKMEKVFNGQYLGRYQEAGLLDKCGGKLQHLISDNATMQILRWKDGGFGMACHNYDGDMLTDEVAQVHRSPGFITSNLIGKNDDGTLIKEFEASHGTVADVWHMHLRGEETSMNPLGMVVALLDAMNHAAVLDPSNKADVNRFTGHCKEAIYAAFRDGKGTRDLSGPTGLTTEKFVEHVAEDLAKRMASGEMPVPATAESETKAARYRGIDEEAMKKFFDRFDTNGDGSISAAEFAEMTIELGIAPLNAEAVQKKMANDKKSKRIGVRFWLALHEDSHANDAGCREHVTQEYT